MSTRSIGATGQREEKRSDDTLPPDNSEPIVKGQTAATEPCTEDEDARRNKVCSQSLPSARKSQEKPLRGRWMEDSSLKRRAESHNQSPEKDKRAKAKVLKAQQEFRQRTEDPQDSR